MSIYIKSQTHTHSLVRKPQEPLIGSRQNIFVPIDKKI